MTDSTEPQPGQVANDDLVLHQLNNHLSVVVGFCDLLLHNVPEEDPTHADILEVRKAGLAAIALLPRFSPRMK